MDKTLEQLKVQEFCVLKRDRGGRKKKKNKMYFFNNIFLKLVICSCDRLMRAPMRKVSSLSRINWDTRYKISVKILIKKKN